MRIIISVCLFLAILAQPQTGRSETFHLRDGRIIEGELEHAYGGILTVVLPDGSRRSIGRNDLSEIRFGPAPDKTPAPSATPPVSAAKESPPGPGFLSPLKASDQRFNTPGATFETWRKAATEGDIDLMVVGEIGLRKLAALLAGTAEALGREINPHVMSATEYKKRVRADDHFAIQVLSGEKLYVIGNDDDLGAMAQ